MWVYIAGECRPFYMFQKCLHVLFKIYKYLSSVLNIQIFTLFAWNISPLHRKYQNGAIPMPRSQHVSRILYQYPSVPALGAFFTLAGLRSHKFRHSVDPIVLTNSAVGDSVKCLMRTCNASCLCSCFSCFALSFLLLSSCVCLFVYLFELSTNNIVVPRPNYDPSMCARELW